LAHGVEVEIFSAMGKEEAPAFTPAKPRKERRKKTG
jgi:hypothetical protein